MGCDGCTDADGWAEREKGEEGRRESERGTDLEELVPPPSRSGRAPPSSWEAQDREEAGPCNQIQLGTFLDGQKIKTQTEKKNS